MNFHLNFENFEPPRAGDASVDGLASVRVAELMADAVVTACTDETIAEAAREMERSDCGALPVLDDDHQPVGMITDRDIAIAVASHGLDPETTLVRDCMTAPVRSCDPTDTAEACLGLMVRNQVRRMPVVSTSGRLIGIITQADLARHADSHKGSGARRAVASAISAISKPQHRAAS